MCNGDNTMLSNHAAMHNGQPGPDPDPPANRQADSKVGTVIFVTTAHGLAERMNKLVFDAIESTTTSNEDMQKAVERRRPIVVYQGRLAATHAYLTADHIQENCYPQRVGTLDLEEMHFDGPPESFPNWWTTQQEEGNYESRTDLMEEIDRRTKWRESIAIEPVRDDEEEEEDTLNPVPDVGDVAFYGVLGQLTKETQPHTEANALFVLLHLLAFTGCAMGRTPHLALGSDLHRLNVGIGILAKSGSRKGSAGSTARELFRKIDPHFADNNILSGLNSGKGLLVNVRDSKVTRGPNGKELEDPGISDKRRVFNEPEFAAVLRMGHADTNPLLCYVRQALDGDHKICSLSKDPESATGAFITIIGHCNPADLKSQLTSVDKANGTAGRFMWHFGARSKLVPGGGAFFELGVALSTEQEVALRLNLLSGQSLY